MQVYQCEYQEYAIQYISECSSGLRTVDIPFFPFPDNAPGSCSCNLGKLYLAVNGSENEGANCVSSISNGVLADPDKDPVITANMQEACACCGESGAISAYVHVLPGGLLLDKLFTLLIAVSTTSAPAPYPHRSASMKCTRPSPTSRAPSHPARPT